MSVSVMSKVDSWSPAGPHFRLGSAESLFDIMGLSSMIPKLTSLVGFDP